ncbi:MAG: transglycosylase SLT domain-containing protein [Gammaproteobacteria bacterium]|nr:transglycosylase SLT domain-containing protein [Gammaproteobacteria bacterium]
MDLSTSTPDKADSLSIAPLSSRAILAAGAVLLSFALAAIAVAATLELPSLGNTPDDDLELSQEVDDQTVYDPAEVAAPTPPVLVKKSSVPHAAIEEGDGSPTVWDRIRAGNKIPLTDSERVQYYTDRYIEDALWVNKILERGTPFIAHLVNALESRFLPPELALLPAIESGYQPHVVSEDNAAGLWQIVPLTAEEIGIQRSVWFDGRSDLIISTTAALDYLSYLNAEFNGDWELTLAAYNAGPGRVRAAVKKNEKNSKPATFSELDLPAETRDYLPKLVALLKMIKDESQVHLDLPPISLTPALTQVDVKQRISIDKAAELADISEAQLRVLNAGLIHGVTSPRGPHVLYLPTNKADQFSAALTNVNNQDKLYSLPRTHTVVAGDTLSELALKYGISQKQLRDMNKLDDSNIKLGQKLSVIDYRLTSPEAIEYTVSSGDTLSGIAEKFSVDIGDISDNTGAPLQGELIKPGDRLKIQLSLNDAG